MSKHMVEVTASNGARHQVQADVFDVGRRLMEGDPTCGWEGDPTMCLVVNQATGKFEVYAEDIHGVAYRAGSWPFCDNRIIVAMAQGHWKHAKKQFEAMIAENEAVDREKDYQGEQLAGEMAQHLAWAGAKDLGVHDFTSMHVPEEPVSETASELEETDV